MRADKSGLEERRGEERRATYSDKDHDPGNRTPGRNGETDTDGGDGQRDAGGAEQELYNHQERLLGRHCSWCGNSSGEEVCIVYL